MFDYHLHSSLSFDSTQSMEELVKAAEIAGLQEICITEHMDLDPNGLTHDMELDFDRYEKSYADLLASHPRLVVRKGMELGVTPHQVGQCAKIAATHPMDFIICSLHFIDGYDPYYMDIYDKYSVSEVYWLYLRDLADCLCQYKDYDVVGHIGYPSKYFRGKHPSAFRYEDFPDQLDQILKTIISDGKGIEINTSGFDKLGDFIPSRSILARYRELGGRIVTVGSDAHAPEKVGHHIQKALQLLKEMGFDSVYTFAQRIPIPHSLP